jgi:8-oxo-dGTP pyrophosphatase MutT (NUDIX family)
MVDNKVLVVKNWFGSGYWQLPGGGIKFGEKPLDGINRELREELGIEVLNGTLITKEPLTTQSRGLLLRQFYALYRLDTQPKVAKSRELTACTWLDIDDAPIPQQVRRLL